MAVRNSDLVICWFRRVVCACVRMCAAVPAHRARWEEVGAWLRAMVSRSDRPGPAPGGERAGGGGGQSGTEVRGRGVCWADRRRSLLSGSSRLFGRDESTFSRAQAVGMGCKREQVIKIGGDHDRSVRWAPATSCRMRAP